MIVHLLGRTEKGNGLRGFGDRGELPRLVSGNPLDGVSKTIVAHSQATYKSLQDGEPGAKRRRRVFKASNPAIPDR